MVKPAEASPGTSFQRQLAGVVAAALAVGLLAPSTALAQGEAAPAAGAALDQVIIATAGATVVSSVLLWLMVRHRQGRTTALSGPAALCERVAGLPGWAALPSLVGGVSLVTALLGMYWDISLHAGDGRDAGPLANPSHYLILAGLFGIFAAGCLAIAMPVGERPGPAAVRIARGWYAPIGGILMAACGGYALAGFPLDDLWHRLFGQDVTLWGPTHLMLIGGAGMTLIGLAVLLVEGSRARAASGRRDDSSRERRFSYLRRTALMGGLLIGLSTFQGEFDFGIPQFRLIFQPTLIALAAGAGLVAARIWIGRGGALAAVAFFLVVRGAVSLIVGAGFGEAVPSLPLYAVSALCIEALAFALAPRRRPLAFGVVGGLLAGTIGLASEWGWSQIAMRLRWTSDMLPEALVAAAVAGVAGGVLGALLATGLRGELPRVAVARGVFAASLVAIAALVANGLVTEAPRGVEGQVSLTEVGPPEERQALATVRLDPADAADGSAWLTTTAWQGGGVVVDHLERTGPGVYTSTEPVPIHGNWKTMIRLHDGRRLAALPVFLPEDPAIPAAEVPATAEFTRSFGDELELLQRERRDDVPAWLFSAGSLLVLALSLAFLLALAWGVSRVGRARGEDSRPAVEPLEESRERRVARFRAGRRGGVAISDG